MARLSETQVGSYEQDGYLSPLELLDAAGVARFRARYEELESWLAPDRAALPPAKVQLLSETHAYLPWAHELATQPALLDAVESVLGPDLLIWHSRWFTKHPGDGTFITWHQDGTYWALDPPHVATAWIALSPATEKSGCMRVVPGSQHGGQLPHSDTHDPRNALTRGQEIAVAVEESEAVSLVLESGEFSLHHIGVVHGSGVNTSADARIGFAVRFVAPEVRQDVEHSFAVLVRGDDRHGHFELLPPPTEAPLPELMARGAAIAERLYANLLPAES